MANVIHRTTLQFLQSVNTPDYPEPTWKHNPDMSQVAGLAERYWKWDSGTERPISQTAGEKTATDAAILAAAKDGAVAPLAASDVPDLLRALALVVMDEVNILRAQHSLPARTVAQLQTALKNKMG